MVNILYSIVDFFCIIILAFLGYQNENYSNIGRKQIYFRFIILNVVIFCLFDALWGFCASNCNIKTGLLVFSTYLYFIFATWVSASWLRFIICNEGYERKIKNPNVFFVLLLIPLFLYIIFIILNAKFGWIFNTDNEIYNRKNVKNNLVLYSVQYCYFAISFIYSLYFACDKENTDNGRMGLIFFTVIPIVTGVLQYIRPEHPYYAIGYMLSCFVVFIFDVIVEREAAAGKTLELKQKQILDKCNSVLSTNGSVQVNIDTLLSLLCSYYDSDRVFLMCFRDEDNTIMDCEYEYCHAGVTKQIDNMKGVSIEENKIWIDRFNYQDGYHVSNVFDYSYGNQKLSDMFRKNLTMSAIISPMRSGGKLYGVIVFDNPRANCDDLSIIRTVCIYINSELLRKKQVDYEQKTSSAVLLTLAAEYSSVYYVDLKTGSIKPYRLDSKINKMYGKYFNENVTYRAIYEMYLNDWVFDEDRELMKPYGDIAFLRKKLKNRTSIRRQFRSKNRYEYYQAKWVKVGKDSDKPEAFVLGFANISEQVHNKELLLEQKKVIEKRQTELFSAIEKAEESERISKSDRLTGLYNKIAGQNLINDYLVAKKSSEKYSLIFIDIDKFKVFNDKYGHLVGDDILELVGTAIKKNCRLNDIAVRFGGDEFVILLKNVHDSAPAVRKARSIQQELKNISDCKEYNLTCSIGVVTTDSQLFDDAVQKADEALYDVKETGRNNIKIV